MIKIAPSLLAADMGDLRAQVQKVEDAGVDYLHLDVMDGTFVPNISYGPAVIKALRPNSQLFFDVHLMVQAPDRYLEDFVKAGADLLCVHAEACVHLHRTVQRIKSFGVKAAVALNPATPLCQLEEILPDLDMALLMSVNPGFGGQSFITGTLDKLKRLRKMADALHPELDIEVDGGITLANAGIVAASGANVLVSGTGIFGQQDCIAETVAAMRQEAAAASR